MQVEKYLFNDHLKIKSSKYIFQLVTSRKLSNIYHSHEFYEICILLKGSVLHIVNDKKVTMKTGDCIILTPNDTHSFAGQSEDMEFIGLSVLADEFSDMAGAFQIQLDSLKNSQSFSCLDRLNELKKIAERCYKTTLDDNENKLMLCTILNIYHFVSKNAKPNAPQTLSHALEQMHLPENLTFGVNRFTELSGYSYPHLFRLTKQYYTLTPHDLILKIKFDAAYSRLLHSDMPVDEIAENVGFKSTSHFNTTFKKHFGISPAKLRKSYRSMYF